MDVHSEDAFEVRKDPLSRMRIMLYYRQVVVLHSLSGLRIFFNIQAMDKNKDGFITKGELKLAKKSIAMKVRYLVSYRLS